MSFDLLAFVQRTTQVVETHGDEHVVPCPLCDDPKPDKAHLWVNTKKAKAICYRCGAKYGDAVGIVEVLAGIDAAAAYQMVREADAGLPTWQRMQAMLDPERLRVCAPSEEKAQTPITLPEEFEPVVDSASLPAYALGRGIDLALAKRHGMGVCRRGFYAGRLIIPVLDEQRDLGSFVARLMRDKHDAIKVLYPKGSKTGRLLFNAWQAKRYDTVVICEGVFDALRVGPMAVALFGKHASREQMQRLMDLGRRRRLVVFLDADAQSEARMLARDLTRWGQGEVLWARPPGDRHDPGECSAAEVAQALEAAMVFSRGEVLRRQLGVAAQRHPVAIRKL